MSKFNKTRIERAWRALDEYHDEDDLVSPIVDLLADLMHYAQATGSDFENALRIARGHFAVEQTEAQAS